MIKTYLIIGEFLNLLKQNKVEVGARISKKKFYKFLSDFLYEKKIASRSAVRYYYLTLLELEFIGEEPDPLTGIVYVRILKLP